MVDFEFDGWNAIKSRVAVAVAVAVVLPLDPAHGGVFDVVIFFKWASVERVSLLIVSVLNSPIVDSARALMLLDTYRSINAMIELFREECKLNFSSINYGLPLLN